MSDDQHRSPPAQDQSLPGSEEAMTPQPETTQPERQGSGKLDGKVALITGGDSGIGRSVAVLFAREGADVAIVYLDEDNDASDTKDLVEAEGKRCLTIKGDVGDESFAQQAVQQTVDEYGKLNVLVNNAGEQHMQESLTDISAEQLERTFRTNIFGMFFTTKAALQHLSEDDAIVNSCSVTAFQGNPTLIDYSSTKGAIVSFTRALSQNLASKNIRVNSVAPGPVWTPLIPATFPPEQVEGFGEHVPLGRPGQPEEIAPCYVFLASSDSSFITGQTLHPNGGTVIGG